MSHPSLANIRSEIETLQTLLIEVIQAAEPLVRHSENPGGIWREGTEQHKIWCEYIRCDGRRFKEVVSHVRKVMDPSASPVPDAQLLPHDVHQVIAELLNRDMSNTCLHESTHRGGNIWEICDDCGHEWAVDEPYRRPKREEPEVWNKASALLKYGKVAPPTASADVNLERVQSVVDRLQQVTGFIRFETGDRVKAAASLSEEAADLIKRLAGIGETK
jgi:hypothetical protein